MRQQELLFAVVWSIVGNDEFQPLDEFRDSRASSSRIERFQRYSFGYHLENELSDRLVSGKRGFNYVVIRSAVSDVAVCKRLRYELKEGVSTWKR